MLKNMIRTTQDSILIMQGIFQTTVTETTVTVYLDGGPMSVEDWHVIVEESQRLLPRISREDLMIEPISENIFRILKKR